MVGRFSLGNISIGIVFIARKELRNTADTITSIVIGLLSDADTKLMSYFL